MEEIYSGEHEENNGVVKVRSTREKGKGDIVEEEEEEQVLKRRIAGHPLYGLLLENHTDCLKVYIWKNYIHIYVYQSFFSFPCTVYL